MKIEVLISCMHQPDAGIIHRTNVQTDVVCINQCDRDSIEKFSFENKKGETCCATFVCTTERGLSRSRNMAIRHATGDVCLICDDDETLADDYAEVIAFGYTRYPNASLIAFALERKDCAKTYPRSAGRLGFKQIFSTSSLQITFKREDILQNSIFFDEKMGSGTGNGGGEENKFQFDCRAKGLGMYYVPGVVATINPGDSFWFHGYTAKFFRNWGWSIRRILGFSLGLAYIGYVAFLHKRHENNKLSRIKMYKNLFKGFFDKR